MYNFISVVIPTYKPVFLRDTLNALRKQKYPGNMYEVIVVENPIKTDEVYNACKVYNAKYYISELGSNRARNVGISRSQGNWIALCDDDILPQNGWLAGINNRINNNPGHGVYGGPVEIVCEKSRPSWLYGEFLQYLSAIYYGPSVIDFSVNCGMHLVSANCFFSKEKWANVGGFDESVGYHGDSLIPNDEVEFFYKMAFASEEDSPYLYDGGLGVAHIIRDERTKLDWLKYRFYNQGIADARMFAKNNDVIDIYHNISYNDKFMRMVDINTVMDVRNIVQNEAVTREYIKNIIICKTEYMVGFNKELAEFF